MPGPSEIINRINLATNGGKKPGWEDFFKPTLTDMAEVSADRGVLHALSVNALGALSGEDSGWVAVQGVGLFRYNPVNALPLPTDAYTASGGGRWELVLRLNKGPYVRVIGDSTTTVFNIEHNLNTLFPTVLQADTLNSAPYGYITTGVVEVIDANNIRVTYPTPPATLSTTLIVKP